MTPDDLQTCSKLRDFLSASFKGASFGNFKMDDAVASLGRVLAFAATAQSKDSSEKDPTQ